jgi:hypothetical protein
MNHSPEPWKTEPYTGPSPIGQIYTITGSNGKKVIAGLFGENIEEVLKNLKRITSCVNACAGIPNEALNKGFMEKMFGAMKAIKCNDVNEAIILIDEAGGDYEVFT